jgi:hypothetical protein
LVVNQPSNALEAQSRPARDLWSWYWSAIFAIAFLWGTDLVPGWGVWYSASPYFREQTEALIHGSVALQNTPTALRNDLVWYRGGVQQVWGLGVPIWRLPFEILAKICGSAAFPDRLAFGMALFVTSLLAFRALQPMETTVVRKPLRFGLIILVIFFPPFWVLCRSRFDIYEEAVAYGYLYGISLFFAVLQFLISPTRRKLFFLSLLAGFAAFVRPTAGAYGIATIIILWLHWLRSGRKFQHLLVSAAAFLFPCILLCYTNQVRFGSGTEFGHSLNLNGFPIWYFTRFYNPFAPETLLSAAHELFGALFCKPELNGFNWDMHGLFWGQSMTPRWRHFYISCFDLSYCLFLILAAGILTRHLFKWKQALNGPSARIVLTVGWSLISVFLLVLFYLFVPVFSNRYAFDFAAGFAAAIVGVILQVEHLIERFAPKKTFCSWTCVVLITTWALCEIVSGRTIAGPSPAVNAAELSLMPKDFPPPDPLPDAYKRGQSLNNYHIPYNGAGWDVDTGQMDTVVVLFVQDPEFIRLEVASNNNEAINCTNLQAKIGLEFLAVASIRNNGNTSVVEFCGPRRKLYQAGIQVAFLAYVDKQNLASPTSPVRLLSVQWRR